MQLQLKVATCMFVIFILLPCGLSIKCWTCRSDVDPKCGDPFDNSTLPITDCNRERFSHLTGIQQIMCRKIRQKVNSEWQYIRDCAYVGEVGVQGDERLCLKGSGTDNIFTESCTCNSRDGCNSSSMFKPLPLLLAAFIVLPSLLYKIFV